MVANEDAIVHIPDHLDPKEAGPLMCAGITTFNSLKHSGALAGEVVVVQGLGGLGHLGVQFARKMGFYTVVVSRGANKAELAKKLGAHLFIDTEKQDAIKEIKALGGARIILCTAPDAKSIEELIPAVGLNGQVLMVAITPNINVPIFALLGKSASLRVWASGDSRDSFETVKFAQNFDVKPMIEVFPFDKAPEAFEHMLSNKARFRVVLDIGKK